MERKWVTLLVVTQVILCGHGALSQGGSNCLNQTCGNMNVSYPFKLTSNACPSFSPFFHLDCKEGGQLYLRANSTYNDDPMRVLHILDNRSLVVDATKLGSSPVSAVNNTCLSSLQLSNSNSSSGFPFFISDENRFVSWGCSNVGVFVGYEYFSNSTVSTSSENSLHNITVGGCAVLNCSDNNRYCLGHICCDSGLGPGTSYRGIAYVVSNATDASYPMECESTYATLYHPQYTNVSTKTYGLKLQWALPFNPNQSISHLKEAPHFECSKNSNFTTVDQVPGYYCFCPPGFKGDGYLNGSRCSDIDECIGSNDCIPGKSTCINNDKGSYSCKCNSNYYVGDGLRMGSGCSFSPTLRTILAVSGAILSVGLLIGTAAIFAIWWRRRTKRKYFLLNGGVQLQDIIMKAGGKRESMLFTSEELKAATKNFADHTKLGMGGFGTVYKGTLPDGRLIAIKKSNRVESGNEQFLNEMQILMHINHRNIVRLLGCCMEKSVPLLVYEYVSHGNVRENLDATGADVIGWEQRLKVARQTAEALAYLHTAAFPPILHRDVKSANILLDDNLDAKVADFGVSRLVPDGVQGVSTAVQGTIGYLDPEYFQTLLLTDKSDVYSFGVMLVELISGRKPVDRQVREPEFTNLALLFIHHMQQARGEELIDPRLVDPAGDNSRDTTMVRSSIMAVSDLALRCLALHGADRPSMSILVDEIRRIAHALHHDMNVDEDSLLMPLLDKHGEAGVVVSKDGEFSVQPTSSTISFGNLDAPPLPR